MTITIANLRTKTNLYINESAGSVWSATNTDLMINKAQRDVAMWLIQLEPTFLQKSTAATITRVSGTSEYTLPTDFLALIGLWDSNDLMISPIHPHEKEYKRGFYFSSATQITIVPDTVSEACTLEYAYLPSDLSDASTTSALPDICEHMIAMKAAIYLKALTEETNQMAVLWKLYESECEEVKKVLFTRKRPMHYSRIRDVRNYGGVPSY